MDHLMLITRSSPANKELPMAVAAAPPTSRKNIALEVT